MFCSSELEDSFAFMILEINVLYLHGQAVCVLLDLYDSAQ